jgi:hypothetical protein
VKQGFRSNHEPCPVPLPATVESRGKLQLLTAGPSLPAGDVVWWLNRVRVDRGSHPGDSGRGLRGWRPIDRRRVLAELAKLLLSRSSRRSEPIQNLRVRQRLAKASSRDTVGAPNGRRIPRPPAGRSSNPSSSLSSRSRRPSSDSAVGSISHRIQVWRPPRLSTWRCGMPSPLSTRETAPAAESFWSSGASWRLSSLYSGRSTSITIALMIGPTAYERCPRRCSSKASAGRSGGGLTASHLADPLPVTDYLITSDSRRVWRITVAFVID